MQRPVVLALALLCVGCAPRVTAVAPLYETVSRGDVRDWEGPEAAFEARLLDSAIGLAAGCVVLDLPPEGRWTVFVEVVEPGASPLAAGQRLCTIVHSPSFYEVGFGSQPAACRVALSEDVAEVPLWICGEGGIPVVVVE